MIRVFFFLISFNLVFTLQSQDSLNVSDNDGKQGSWIGYHENGEIRYKGEFKDNVPVGLFVYFNDEKLKLSEVQFLNPDSSRAQHFHTNGNIMAQGSYCVNKKCGEWMFYDNKQILSSTEMFSGGLKNGISTSYYLNGKIAETKNHIDDLIQGECVQYFDNGNIRFKGNYIDGNLEGEVLYYFPGGEKKTVGSYKHAVKDGLWIYYLETGAIQIQEVYEKGKMVKQELSEGAKEEKKRIDAETLEKMMKKDE